jgi:hypothetical protein
VNLRRPLRRCGLWRRMQAPTSNASGLKPKIWEKDVA